MLSRQERNTMKTNILTMIKQADVVWKPLGEVVHSIKTGLNPRQFFKLNTSDATNYYVTIRELKKHKIVFSEKTDKLNDDALILCNNRSNLEVGDVLFSGTGTIGEVALITEKPKNWNIKEGVYSIKPIQEILFPKFLLYLFETETIRSDFLSKSAGGTVKSVPMKELAKVKIPIPPLELQKEIVKRLDILTELEATLEAELSLRKKQYQYYRDLLLSENELAKVGFEWKSLGELAEIGTGSRNTNEAVIDGIYPFFVRSQEPRKINEYEFDEVAIITAGDGVGVGKVFHFVTGKYALHQRAYRIVVKSNALLPKFLFYFIKTSFAHYLEKASVNSSVTSLRKPMFEKFQIPIPPLETQAQIVKILDKFDRLTSSISEGLPKEIELRRKQYEYYRELLLGFARV